MPAAVFSGHLGGDSARKHTLVTIGGLQDAPLAQPGREHLPNLAPRDPGRDRLLHIHLDFLAVPIGPQAKSLVGVHHYCNTELTMEERHTWLDPAR